MWHVEIKSSIGPKRIETPPNTQFNKAVALIYVSSQERILARA